MRQTVAPLRWILFLSLTVALLGSTVALVSAAAGDTIRISVDSAGVEANNSNYSPSISADGGRVTFYSRASNLVGGDANGQYDVFVRDLNAATTALVSVAAAGGVANNQSDSPRISADGHHIAFLSYADNIVSGDTNGRGDIFVRDLGAGTTTLASQSSSGTIGDGESGSPSISSDGRYVAFRSRANNLVDGDTNDEDIFVRDLVAGTTVRVSVSSSETQGDFGSYNPAISADGQTVAFDSNATNLVAGDTNASSDVFVRDVVLGTTTLVSANSSGVQGNLNSGGIISMSADGRYVAFPSAATNLTTAVDSNGDSDIFVRDRLAGTTARVTVDSSGHQADNGSYEPCISADGRRVAFYSAATNLVPGDTNSTYDVFVRDRLALTTTRASVDSTGAQTNAWSNGAALSSDGRYIAFTSDASNLVTDDTNLREDVFVHDGGPLQPAAVVSVTTGSRDSLPYAGAFLVAGTFTSSGIGVANEEMILQSASPGAAFADTSLKARTGATGAFSFLTTPTDRTFYRVRSVGSSELVSNGAAYATPQVYLRAPAAPSTMRRGKAATVYGLLGPKHRAGTKPVRIYKYKRVGSKWRPMGYVVAKAYDSGSSTRYSARMTLPSRGAWRLRAYSPADGLHAATWSAKYDYVKVR